MSALRNAGFRFMKATGMSKRCRVFGMYPSRTLDSVLTCRSVRDVPIPEPLAEILGNHFVRFPAGPADPVFPPPLGDYRTLRRTWGRICEAAGGHAATLHDCRHTVGGHRPQAGVPVARRQKPLGHSS